MTNDLISDESVTSRLDQHDWESLARVETAWLTLPLRSLIALDEGQKSESTGSQARGRGGLEPVTALGTFGQLQRYWQCSC